MSGMSGLLAVLCFAVSLLGCGATDTLDGLRENKTNVGGCFVRS